MISRYWALPSGVSSPKSSGSRASTRALLSPSRARLLEQPLVEEAERAAGVREAQPMAVQRVVDVLEPALVEAGEERARALQVLPEELVQPCEEQRPDLRVGHLRPEPADLVLAVDVVAAEELVGALARDHDLEARLADGARTAGGAASARCAASASRRARPRAGSSSAMSGESTTTRVRSVPSSRTNRSWNSLSSNSGSRKPTPNEFSVPG